MFLNKRTITQGLWKYLFLIIALEPAAFEHFRVLDIAYTVAQVLMLLMMLFLEKDSIFTSNRQKRVSGICMMMFVYYAYLVLDTFIHRGRTTRLALQAIHFLGFLLYLDVLLKNNPKAVFTSALNILTVFIALNCVIIFILPGGLYETNYYANNYLLGYDNQNINFIMPALVLVLLKNQYVRKCKWHIIVVYGLAWITAIRIWSGMTLVTVALMTLIAVVAFSGKRTFITRHLFSDKLFNLFNYIIISLAANVALVVFRLQYYLDFLITNVLHRSLSLTGRTFIWDRCMDYIQKSWLFGYGREVYAERAVKFGKPINHAVGLHAHNRMLETLYSGGVILFAMFMWMLFYAAARLSKVRKTNFAKILAFGIFIYLIGMLTEYYDYCLWFWGMLVMADNAPLIVREGA